MSGPRILFLINSLAGGGAERVMAAILTASHDRMAANPFSLALLDDEPIAYPPPDWLPVHYLHTGGSLVRGVKAVRTLIAREKPDLIVSFLTRANIIAVIAGKAARCRVVVSERVNTSAHLAGAKSLPARLLVRAGYRLADRVIAVSSGVADDLARNFAVPAAKITAIANPVDVDLIRRRAAEPAALPVAGDFIVAMGRLTQTKNPALLIDAYAQAEIAPALVILGEGTERPALEQAIAARGLQGRVVLAGFDANPFAVMARAIAYASPSNGEGFPNALVEAMAIGLPVLSTNCASGPSEILADRTREAVTGPLDAPYGMLVPVNDPTAMAEGFRRLAADPALRARYGAAAAARAEEYGVARAVERYWSVFAVALSRA